LSSVTTANCQHASYAELRDRTVIRNGVEGRPGSLRACHLQNFLDDKCVQTFFLAPLQWQDTWSRAYSFIWSSLQIISARERIQFPALDTDLIDAPVAKVIVQKPSHHTNLEYWILGRHQMQGRQVTNRSVMVKLRNSSAAPLPLVLLDAISAVLFPGAHKHPSLLSWQQKDTATM
jgi:hypothetical protein